MDMIGHYHPRVQFVVPHVQRDVEPKSRLSKKGGSAPSLIEQVVHRDEGFAGMCRKTVVQAEGDEQGLADDMLRESTPFQHHVQ